MCKIMSSFWGEAVETVESVLVPGRARKPPQTVYDASADPPVATPYLPARVRDWFGFIDDKLYVHGNR